MIKLSEREAWLSISERIKRNDAPFGICFEVSELFQHDRITPVVLDGMSMKLEDYKFRYVKDFNRWHGYYWPLNDEGQKRRVEFCLRQANKLKRRRTTRTRA